MEEKKFAVLTDIAGAEDHYGDMDFKVAGTRDGITALQMDIKVSGITLDIMRKALEGSVSSLGDLKGRKIAFLGDTGFNMANSWILGASLFGMKISLGGPKGFEPSPEIRALLKAEGRKEEFHFTTDPYEAVAGADLVYTDVWTSMGQEAEAAQRLGVSVRTIRRACAAGEIPCTRLGPRTWMIPSASLPSTIRQRAPRGSGRGRAPPADRRRAGRVDPAPSPPPRRR